MSVIYKLFFVSIQYSMDLFDIFLTFNSGSIHFIFNSEFKINSNVNLYFAIKKGRFNFFYQFNIISYFIHLFIIIQFLFTYLYTLPSALIFPYLNNILSGVAKLSKSSISITACADCSLAFSVFSSAILR